MVNEVKQRIDLIISCQGTRSISRENLEFMFEKYELTGQERKEIYDYCASKMIRIFSEEDAAVTEKAVEAEEEVETSPEPKEKKKGLFSKLFGR